jgi:hypothetical protein
VYSLRCRTITPDISQIDELKRIDARKSLTDEGTFHFSLPGMSFEKKTSTGGGWTRRNIDDVPLEPTDRHHTT